MLAALVFSALWHVGLVAAWLAVALWAAWVIKDAALYPLVRGSYEGRRGGGIDELVGREAVARERLAPEGYVRVRGELWRARIEGDDGAVEVGTAVEVTGVRGGVLVVSPVAAGRDVR